MEDQAGDPEGPEDSVVGRASHAARAAAAVADHGKDQVSGQIVDLGQAARRDDPRHWRALAACILAAVAAADRPADPPGDLVRRPGGAARRARSRGPARGSLLHDPGRRDGRRRRARRPLRAAPQSYCSAWPACSQADWSPPRRRRASARGGHVGMSLSTAVVVPLSLAAVMGTFGHARAPGRDRRSTSPSSCSPRSAGPALAQAPLRPVGFGATLMPADPRLRSSPSSASGAGSPRRGPGRADAVASTPCRSRSGPVGCSVWSTGRSPSRPAGVRTMGSPSSAARCVLFGAVSRIARAKRLHLPARALPGDRGHPVPGRDAGARAVRVLAPAVDVPQGRPRIRRYRIGHRARAVRPRHP